MGAGHWLWADAVSVPRSYLVDQAFGLADAAPRATPQDAALAALSGVVDGGLLVKAITLLALVAAGTGGARLARCFLPGSHAGVQLVAATFAIDNLWVAERLLQGQWSLLVGYGALGHVAVVAARLREQSALSGWAELGFWLAAGGLVPTGALFVLALAGLTLAIPGGSRWLPRMAALAGLAAVAAGPWLAAGLFGLSRGELGDGASAGAAAFAARLDQAGWLALGGIWNAQSVPGSQLGAFGLIANLVVAALVAAGAFVLRDRLREDRVFGSLFALGLVAVVFVGLSATGAAQGALEAAMTRVPALGILRDGQKWAALAWPSYALALAALAARCKPGSLLLVPAVLLLVPDALWGAGGRLGTVRYPQGWFEVREAVSADQAHGALLTLPVGITRQYAWAGRPQHGASSVGGPVSIDPAPRLLPVPVAQSGDLLVDGAVVPGEGLARQAGGGGSAGRGLAGAVRRGLDRLGAPRTRPARLLAAQGAGGARQVRARALGSGFRAVPESGDPVAGSRGRRGTTATGGFRPSRVGGAARPWSSGRALATACGRTMPVAWASWCG
ncbi:hypothetical protein [Segniliparus rugosus]|uniref:Uncharacterized protein n=1 Tax=Segniliparus rugosus (strain ATCC BAA-974 / DSM 45345 / CCUG 50838 / CIP 108380 / JCM 13579 / CDC 945) TaxID=679197 RepID=U1N5C6_SEGRC|nr:hypothetical protein [Segniliparus rugosus]ERG69354.1 hypothetical protein HMPREF9336_04051 [Segniliparus rugosus ATCC BAA-974]